MTVKAVADPDSNTTEDNYRSLDELAKTFSVSRRTLERHVTAGNIAVIRFGKRIAVSAAEVRRLASAGLPPLPRSARPAIAVG